MTSTLILGYLTPEPVGVGRPVGQPVIAILVVPAVLATEAALEYIPFARFRLTLPSGG